MFQRSPLSRDVSVQDGFVVVTALSSGPGVLLIDEKPFQVRTQGEGLG